MLFSLKLQKNEYFFLNKHLVGGGSFGTIHIARVNGSQDVVGVKKLDNKSFEQNKSELKMLKLFSKNPHPSIIKLKDHYTRTYDGGSELHLVFEYLSERLSETMKDYNIDKISMHLNLVKILSFQLFRALAHIHSFGICHREIVPDNILVNLRTYQLKIADFSCAKKFSKDTVFIFDDCHAGSVRFRAPEILSQCDDVTGFPADMWSAGCILAELLMNCSLFNGARVATVLSQHVVMLGTPDSNDDFQFPPHIELFQCNKLGVEARMTQKRANIFSDHDTLPTFDHHAIDLLTHLLVYMAPQRLLPMEACHHPFFDDLFWSHRQIYKLPAEIFSFTPQELSGRHWKLSSSLQVRVLRDNLMHSRCSSEHHSSFEAKMHWYRNPAVNGPESDVDNWFGDDVSCCGTTDSSSVPANSTACFNHKVHMGEKIVNRLRRLIGWRQ